MPSWNDCVSKKSYLTLPWQGQLHFSSPGDIHGDYQKFNIHKIGHSEVNMGSGSFTISPPGRRYGWDKVQLSSVFESQCTRGLPVLALLLKSPRV